MAELKTWNWQRDDWPDFHFDSGKLAGLEADFLRRAGVFSGSFMHIAQDGKKLLEVELMSEEAMKTSEIEGEILNRDSVQSSIRRHFGFWVCT